MYETFPHPPPICIMPNGKANSSLQGVRTERTFSLWQNGSLCVFYIKKNKPYLMQFACCTSPSWFPRVIFAWRAGETFVAPTCSDCRQKSSYTLADLACGAACLSDTPVPCYDDSSAFCPLWAFVTVYSLWWTETWWNGHGDPTCWWF